MSPHLQRMSKELDELTDKIKRATVFLSNPIFAGLASVDQSLLVQQIAAMKNYQGILEIRLQRGITEMEKA